ncbi:hypothetical protein [Streptomyces sp. NPDC058268]|uniref:hypothetical protein n=1 Tax=Streptomyces sp. NPDC058268 TaxID=3346413 RepID=UPI0036F0FBBA
MDVTLDRYPLSYVRRLHQWSADDLTWLLRAQALQHGLHSGIDRNRIWRWERGTTPQH